MNIFTKGALARAASRYQDAKGDILAWIKVAKEGRWKSFLDLRISFPSADDMDGVVVFNIRHNRYRLLTVVKYFRDVDGGQVNGSIFIKAFMTHAEYDRWSALSRQKREKALWPQS